MAAGKSSAQRSEVNSVRAQLDTALRQGEEATVYFTLEAGEETERTSLRLSREGLEIFSRVLELMEKGADVEVLAREAEVTTQQAADLLNVSRPYLVELLESGEIPFHKVGSHRRVQMIDLLQYKRNRKEQSRKTMEELAREDEKLGLDY